MLPPLVAQMPAGELIIVDNGSSDGTAEWLAVKHPTIRILKNAKPLSFAAAVNQGIHEAKLHPHAPPQQRHDRRAWVHRSPQRSLPPRTRTFLRDSPDPLPPRRPPRRNGKAVWRRHNDLDFPVRCDDPLPNEDQTWVLYGSGGCSLFDTQKLLALGGVAELYEPAYVEDLDFGFRAWQRGWPSVYCANARVEHRHRSTTSRFYTERQIDFFVERNYLRFMANAISDPRIVPPTVAAGDTPAPAAGDAGTRSRARYAPGHPANRPRAAACGRTPFRNRDPRAHERLRCRISRRAAFRDRTKVLIASPYLPYPLSHGGAVRIYNLMKQAAETSNLILVAFVDNLASPPAELLAICSQIVLVHRHGTHYRRNTTRPDMVEEFDSDTFRACLKQAVHQWRPQIAQLEFTWMARYADACRPAKTILVEHDITFDLQQQLLETVPSGGVAKMELEQQLAKWRTFETAAWGKVDCIVTMSAKDTQLIAGARSVECLPNGVDCERFQPQSAEPEPRRLLLIGSFAHLPNLLALEFFLRDVWPRLGQGYTLHVIGGARHEYYLDFFRDRVSLDLTQPGIELEGFVEDVRAAYHRAAIVLAPLTASAGTNIKVLEAMAMGKVVVSTAAGVNGLDVTPGHDVLLSDAAAQMAEQIRQIENDDAGRKSIQRNARQTALRYDWNAIGARQQALYDRLRR
jgi:glycosyltransferase involved in cell wall biosynthesis